MAKTLLLDFNSLGFAAQDSTKLHHNGQEVQAIYNFIRTLRKLAVSYPEHRIVAVDDGAKGKEWRKEIYPLYKGQRNDDPARVAEKEAYIAQKPAIIEALKLLGIDYVCQESAEADDLAAYLAKRLTSHPDGEVVLVTSDKDWLQLITPQVSWNDPRFNRMCDVRSFEDVTGYDSPKKFLQAKAIVGDTSDNIPGVGGIGNKGALELLTNYGSVENFLETADPSKLPKAFKRLYDNEVPTKWLEKKWGKAVPALDAYNRNMTLMSLQDAKAPDKEELTYTKGGSVDKEGFMEFCEEYYFKSILNQFPEFVSSFER